MADNVTLNTGSGGDTIAADDIGGVKHQLVKVEFGVADSATPVSSSNPLPVVQTGTPALPTGAATESTLGGVLTQTDFDTKVGSLTETAPTTDTASSGLNGRLQRIAQRITSLIALLPTALGSGGGLKVDGSGTALPVSAASLPLPSGAATETTLGSVLTQTDFDTKTGSLTETAPSTDTASSGLNGRLQRIAQRITSLITALGSPFQAGGALGAGSAIIGKVGIDQTTPGTTNGISLTSMVLTSATLQNAVSATGNGSTLTVSGYDTVVFQVSGTFTATVTFEASADSGTTWTSLSTVQVGTALIGNTATAAGVFRGSCSGFTTVRARVTWTSGTSVTVIANVVPDATHAFASNANMMIGGTTVDGNSGSKSAQTVRVVLATDQPQLTNKLLVTPDANSAVNCAQMAGTATSVGVGSSDNGTQRIVPANANGKTLLSAGGSASTSGNNTLVAAGTNKLKVYAFTLSTTSTTSVTCIFQSGASGTELWRVVLQAPTSVSTGANLVVQPPAWLFATASATLLNLNLSAAQTVHWSVSYFDEA